MNYYKSQSGQVYAYDDRQVEQGLVANSLIVMTQQEIALHLNSTVALAQVNEVSMRQARLALLSQGLLSQVEPIIAALPSLQKEAAQIEWEYATSVKRNSPLVLLLAEELDLDLQDLDALFLAASQL